jgi:hypothetical protein
MSRIGLSLLAWGLAAGCQKEEDVWVQFNGTDDVADIGVTADAALGEPLAVDITSSTGTVLVGDVWIDPGTGPVGTEHQITLSIAEEFEERVTVARIEVSSDRGEHTYDMVQDSAEGWRWVLSLTSLGVEGEVRTDSLRFRLFEVVPAEEATGGGGGGLFDAVF